MSASNFYKRFPAQRRTWCVPVTSALAAEPERSRQARAVAQESGDEVPPQGSASVPVDLKSRGSKE